MLGAARLLLYGITGAVVAGLAQFHALFIGEYELSADSRAVWTIAYAVVLCVAAYASGLPDLPRNAYQFLSSAILASVGGTLMLSVLQLVLGSPLLPRFVVFWALLFLPPAWTLTGFIASRGRRGQVRRDRVVLVAEPEDAEALEQDLLRSPERRARLVVVVPPDDAVNMLERDASTADASVVVLSRQALASDAVVERVAALHERGVRVRTLSLFYDEWLGKLPLSELERVALMFDIGELHRARYSRVKRALDFVSAVALLPVLVLVTPVVVAGNIVGNRGPLLYRQERVGRGGRRFTMLKFRTMKPDQGPAVWTSRDDPRVTAFGRVLRRTHLDELPQLVNIVRGDLSIVGPRPEQPRYVEQLAEKLPFYQLRHLVRPGVTGWAQVKYDYGADETDAMEKLQYEFWYLRHQSLTLDLRIIGRTLRSIASGAGR